MFRRIRGLVVALLTVALAFYLVGIAGSYVPLPSFDIEGIISWLPWEIPFLTASEASGEGDVAATEPSGEASQDTGESEEGAGQTQVVDARHGFDYACLDPGAQDAYDLIYDGIVSRAASFKVGDHSVEEVEAAYWSVRDDHPELFWVEGFEYTIGNVPITVSPQFNCDAEQIDQIAAQIEAAAWDVVATLPEDASTYDKVRWFYEWIINETDYVTGAPNHQNVQSVFLTHQSVCAGYSSAFAYLCHLVGIPCGTVSGTAEGRGSHAWNIVDIDGVYTYVDVTWGDPVFAGEDVASTGTLTYDYLCLTTEEIGRDHVTQRPAQGLPLCESREYDYCVRAGTYLESFEREALDELIWSAREAGESSLYFKLSSQEDYDSADEYLHSDDLFWGPLDGYTSVRMSYNDSVYTIDLSWS